jgi:GTP-binding protein EngB required for normal cell division
MSGLVASARQALGRSTPLDARIDGLEQAVESARGRLDDRRVDEAADVVERAGARLRLSADHTVVALAGATGSGKSSTFNAMAGLDLAAVGVRRPTTSWATACVWGEEDASELLEWLGIPPRHRVSRSSMLDAGSQAAVKQEKALSGLVLLDLPDHDSTEVSHHLEVERLIRLTDLMVWVLDPQKYADAALHDRFLKPMAVHKDVMLVVLNHIDEVDVSGREAMLADVRRLLELDGLHGVPVIGTSARTGEGMDELRRVIGKRVSDKAATRKRLLGDVSDAADALAAENGDGEPRELKDRDKRELVDALSDAAGVPLVVDAVRRATTIRSRRATGFPLTSWLSRFRPDPLRRLHLDRDSTGRDLVAAARSSVPQANQVQQARVEITVRELCDEAAFGLSQPWVRAVRTASTSRFEDLTDGLDRAVTSADLGVSGTPVWCRLVRVLQWLLLAAALTGAAWLGVLAVMAYLQLPSADPPSWQGFPVPTVLLVLGVASGVVVALLSRVLIAVGSRARARRAERRLRAAVAEVAQRLVVDPVDAELAAHRQTFEGLRRARG